MRAKVTKTAAEAAIRTTDVKAASAAEEAATVKAAEDKAAEAKEEAKEAAAEVTKKRTVRKSASTTTAAKKTATRAVAAKADAIKEAATKVTRKKAEVKENLTVQFEGKSYSQEELMKIAKDVWKFDLKKKVGDLKSIELYIKPEENTCYYVMNDEIAGSFAL